MIRWAVRLVVLWGVIAVLAYFFLQFAPQGITGAHVTAPPPASVAAAVQPSPAAALVNSIVYPADHLGHVYLDAAVNGTIVRFLVDTGASLVVLTPEDARAVGFTQDQLQFDKRVVTANGTALAASVKLREVRLGQLAVDDIDAVVTEHLSVSLLGMSFLRRVDSYEMREGHLTINW
jgi:aspartyl protease family protein